MNSQQEKAIFEGWGWVYDHIARKWVAPNGCEITIDQVMGSTGDPEGDMALMRLIVEHGVRQRP